MLKKLIAYCEAHSSIADPVLTELERETHLTTLSPQMLSGQLQGQLLHLLCRLRQPQIALEIGTFTGYTAICIAKGLPQEGILHTIEINPELHHISRKYIEKAGLQKKIFQHSGNAFDIIPKINTTFDLVFVDAAKADYVAYFHLIIERLNPGGLLIADNVLWSGKVLTPTQDPEALIIDTFNKLVINDKRLSTVLLPVRDGISISVKNY